MRHSVNFAQASQLCAKFSCAELQNSGIPSSSGKRRRRGKGYLGTYRLSLSLFQACRQSVCSTYLTFFTWAVVMWPLATNSSATCYRWLCCQGVCDNEMSLKNLGSSATAVTKALDDLMLHIKRGANRGRQVAKAC